MLYLNKQHNRFNNMMTKLLETSHHHKVLNPKNLRQKLFNIIFKHYGEFISYFLLLCYCSFVILCVHFSLINFFTQNCEKKEKKTLQRSAETTTNSRAKHHVDRQESNQKLTLIPVFVCVCDEKQIKKIHRFFCEWNRSGSGAKYLVKKNRNLQTDGKKKI